VVNSTVATTLSTSRQTVFPRLESALSRYVARKFHSKS